MFLNQPSRELKNQSLQVQQQLLNFGTEYRKATGTWVARIVEYRREPSQARRIFISMSIEDVQRLQQLQGEVKTLTEKVSEFQKNCRHDWGDPVYDPDYKMVGENFRINPEKSHGSDPYMEPTNYRREEIPRWRRQCKLCLTKQHTTKTGTKTVNTGPDFGK